LIPSSNREVQEVRLREPRVEEQQAPAQVDEDEAAVALHAAVVRDHRLGAEAVPPVLAGEAERDRDDRCG
jgi:hypothetical protein